MKMGEHILLPSIAQYYHFWEYCPARENPGFPTWVFPGGPYFANLARKPCENSDHRANEPHPPSTCESFHLLNKIHPPANLLGTMLEPTRQSLCCPQPKHGPTLSHKMSKGRKNCQSPLHRLRTEPVTLCKHIQISTFQGLYGYNNI